MAGWLAVLPCGYAAVAACVHVCSWSVTCRTRASRPARRRRRWGRARSRCGRCMHGAAVRPLHACMAKRCTVSSFGIHIWGSYVDHKFECCTIPLKWIDGAQDVQQHVGACGGRCRTWLCARWHAYGVAHDAPPCVRAALGTGVAHAQAGSLQRALKVAKAAQADASKEAAELRVSACRRGMGREGREGRGREGR